MAVNDDSQRNVAPAVGARRARNPVSAPRRIASHELFAGRKELVIVHDGRDYRLRITQNGKLILTA